MPRRFASHLSWTNLTRHTPERSPLAQPRCSRSRISRTKCDRAASSIRSGTTGSSVSGYRKLACASVRQMSHEPRRRVDRLAWPSGMAHNPRVESNASPLPDIRYARNGGVAIAYQVVGDGDVDLVYVPEFDVESRLLVGVSALARLLPPISSLVSADPVRQARNGSLRSRRPVRRSRDADGGPARGSRRRGIVEPRDLRRARGERDGRVVRGVVSGADAGARALPARADGSTYRTDPQRHRSSGRSPRRVGHPGVVRRALQGGVAVARCERGRSALVRQLGTCRSEPCGRVRAQPRLRSRPTCAMCCRRCTSRRSSSTAPCRRRRRRRMDVAVADPGRADDARLGHRLPSAIFLSPEIADEIERFVAGEEAPAVPESVLATVVFTDIVGSTDHAARIGDRAWRELLCPPPRDRPPRAHPLPRPGARHRRRRVLRDLRRPGTRDPGSAGDRRRRPHARPRSADRHPRRRVRAPRRQDRRARRQRSAPASPSNAGASEVLVSQTVRDLVAGSGISFEDRGIHELKGIPGSWQLFAVAAADT